MPWNIAKLRRTFAAALLRRFPASLDLLQAGRAPDPARRHPRS